MHWPVSGPDLAATTISKKWGMCVCVCGRCARNCPAVPYIAAETRSKKPSSPCTRNTLTKPRETTFASFEPRILHHPVPVGLSPYFATVRHVRKCARPLSSTTSQGRNLNRVIAFGNIL